MSSECSIGSVCLGKAPMKNDEGEIFYCACAECSKEKDEE